jgi:hypothetical protein
MHQQTKGGARAYRRSSSRQSDGRQGAARTASATMSPTTYDPFSSVGSGGGPSPDDEGMQPREDVTTQHGERARRDSISQKAAEVRMHAEQAGAQPSWNEQSVDLLSGAVHAMSAIPEVTEPLTGQWTGGINRASSPDVLSPMAPMALPPDDTFSTSQPGQQPAANLPAVFRQDGIPLAEHALRTSGSQPRPSSGRRAESGGPPGHGQGRTRH